MSLIVKTRHSTYTLDGNVLTSDNPKYPRLEVEPSLPIVGFPWVMRITNAKELGRKSHLMTSSVQSFTGSLDHL